VVFAEGVEAVRPQAVWPQVALSMVAAAERVDAERRDVHQPVERLVAAFRMESHHQQTPLAVGVVSVGQRYHRYQPQERVWSEVRHRSLIDRRWPVEMPLMELHLPQLHSGWHLSVLALRLQRQKSPVLSLVHPALL